MSKPAAWNAHLASGIAVDRANRHPDDLNITSPDAVMVLLRCIEFAGAVWECACGTGAISRVLKHRGFKVVSTDLVARGYGRGSVDFLKTRRLLAPNVVTNPPYMEGLPEAFALHALELGARKVALLVQLGSLQGIGRNSFFKETRLSAVIILAHRPDIRRAGWVPTGNNSTMKFAWIVWDQDNPGYVDAAGRLQCGLVFP